MRFMNFTFALKAMKFTTEKSGERLFPAEETAKRPVKF